MNLFILDRDPEIAASFYCDKHVLKIIVEACQMLSNAYPKRIAPYKHSHMNHPMAKWVRETSANYMWTIKHALALCREYTKRYNKVHACEPVILWCAFNRQRIHTPLYFIPEGKLTDYPRCFGDYKSCIPVTNDIVEDYRNYYKIAKSHFARWKYNGAPVWYNI